MALGIYKQGQGYWVRVMTAVMAGILILAASAWVWGQLERVAASLPRTSWVMNVQPATGEAAAGQAVAILGEAPRTDVTPMPIGRGVIAGVEQLTQGTRVRLSEVKFNTAQDASRIRGIIPAEGSAATLSGPVAPGTAQGAAAIEPLYLQAAGVAVIVIVGSILTYWFVGAKPSAVEFLIATDGEMRKVNWSTRKDVIGSTWVVIMWSVLIAGGLFVVDLMFSNFFQLINVLEN